MFFALSLDLCLKTTEGPNPTSNIIDCIFLCIYE
jgi:hypothetical protein